MAVVGGTPLPEGLGSVPVTVAGTLLVGLVFNIRNFENGRDVISFSAHGQMVIRGLFLFVVILLQSRVSRVGAKQNKEPENGQDHVTPGTALRGAS